MKLHNVNFYYDQTEIAFIGSIDPNNIIFGATTKIKMKKEAI